MSTHTAERRPLGALGRMGVVAALHAGLLYMIANSLGMVPSILENKTEATIIDEPPPIDDPAPQPEPDLTQRRDTVVIPDAPPDLEFESPDVITGPPPDVIESQEQARGSAVVQPLIVGCASGLASPAVSATISAQRNPRRQRRHGRHRGLRIAERPSRRRTHRQEHGIPGAGSSRRWMRRSANGA